MIVTVSSRVSLASFRWPLIVAAASFSLALLWPTTTTTTTTTTTGGPWATTTLTRPGLPLQGRSGPGPGAALLAVGGSADAWIEPRVVDGALFGFTLVSVRPGSSWERAGLRDGDVVTAVDGVDVTDLARVLDALTATRFSRAGGCELRYQRSSSPSSSPVVAFATLNLL